MVSKYHYQVTEPIPPNFPEFLISHHIYAKNFLFNFDINIFLEKPNAQEQERRLDTMGMYWFVVKVQ